MDKQQTLQNKKRNRRETEEKGGKSETELKPRNKRSKDYGK